MDHFWIGYRHARIVADSVNSHKNNNNAYFVLTIRDNYIKPVLYICQGKIVKTGCLDLGLELENRL